MVSSLPRFGHDLRPSFVKQIGEAAEAQGIELDWLSDYWVARLRRAETTKYLTGYTFPVNDAAAANIANDKVASFAVLDDYGLPAVRHDLFRFKAISESDWVDAVISDIGLPVVLKPYSDSGGIDVERATTQHELTAILTSLSTRHRALALSPYLNIQHEHRIVMLDDHALLAYQKVRQPINHAGELEWRHNLRLGAQAETIVLETVAPMVTLARQTMRALGLRFASVDIIEVANLIIVLEVNSAVTLENFSQQKPEFFMHASPIYSDAIQLCFGDHREWVKRSG